MVNQIFPVNVQVLPKIEVEIQNISSLANKKKHTDTPRI
jgi:hypothetical protein